MASRCRPCPLLIRRALSNDIESTQREKNKRQRHHGPFFLFNALFFFFFSRRRRSHRLCFFFRWSARTLGARALSSGTSVLPGAQRTSPSQWREGVQFLWETRSRSKERAFTRGTGKIVDRSGTFEFLFPLSLFLFAHHSLRSPRSFLTTNRVFSHSTLSCSPLHSVVNLSLPLSKSAENTFLLRAFKKKNSKKKWPTTGKTGRTKGSSRRCLASPAASTRPQLLPLKR